MKRVYWQLLLCVALLGVPAFGFAQQEQIVSLILNVTRGGPGTPGNVGYLTLAEAHINAAAVPVDRALLEGGPLSAVQRHIRDVIRAIDPSSGESSPGARAGLLHSVAAIGANIAVARELPGASTNLQNQGKRVIEASDNVIEWTQHLLELGELATRASTIDDAKEVAGRMRRQLRDIRDGKDADGDGQITWRKGEAGLAQLREHVEFLAKAEGLMPLEFNPKN